MDSVLYEDLDGLAGELRQVKDRLKSAGDWTLAGQTQLYLRRLHIALAAYELEHRADPQVQLSMLAHIEGRRHDYTGDAA